MTSGKLQIARIRVENILGVESLEIEPGAITVLEGRNGSGKTSTLTAIRQALGGGQDVKLIRDGAEAGEIVILLDDGTEIRDRITSSGSRPQVRDPQGNIVKGPRRWIKALLDVISLNPIDFVEAKPAKRLELLEGAVPGEIERAQIEEASGEPLPESVRLFGGILERLGIAEEYYYTRRHAVGVEKTQAVKTVEELQTSIPPDDEGAEAIADTLTGLRGERDSVLEDRRITLEELSGICTTRVHELNRHFESGVEGAKAVRDARIEAARQAFERERAAAVDEAELEIARLTAERDKEKAHAEVERDTAQDRARAQAAELSQELDRKIAELEGRSAEVERTRGARRVLEATQKKADDLTEAHEALERAVAAVRNLRFKVLAELPIKGLEVKDGEVWFEGHSWEHLEESRRVWLAVQIAQMRSGRLNLVCVDGLERLDARRFELFRDSLIESGAQLIGARVTDDAELKVTHPGEIEGLDLEGLQ